MYLEVWKLILLIACSAIAGGSTGAIVMAVVAAARDDWRR